MRKPKQGSSVRGSLLTSAQWVSDVDDTMRDYKERKRLGAGVNLPSTPLDPTVVMVRNDSGADRAAGEALEVGAALLTGTLTQERLWFSGDLRGGSLGMCGVLVYPLPDGKIGPLRLWGNVVAQVDINDEQHTHAYFKTNDANPQSNFGGPARIVYKPSGTGLKTCVLCLGDAQYRRKGRTVDTIAADGTGTVNVRLNNISDPGSVEAAYNHMTSGLASIPSDVDVLLWWYDDEEQWVIEAAECTA